MCVFLCSMSSFHVIIFNKEKRDKLGGTGSLVNTKEDKKSQILGNITKYLLGISLFVAE